jgi:phosphatidylglycerol lysyltransferase
MKNPSVPSSLPIFQRLVANRWSRRIAAFLTLLMGILNVYSALVPTLRERMKILLEYFPLFVTHGGRFFTALSGFALLLLAAQLFRRKLVAYIFTEILLILSAIVHLLKGLDVIEAGVALLLAGWIFLIRHQFHARSDPSSVKQGLVALIVATCFTLVYGSIGFALLDRHFKVSFDLGTAFVQTITMFTQFSNPGLEALTRFGKYFADSIYLIALATYLYAIFMLIRPMLVRRPSTGTERENARAIITSHGGTILAPFALLPDKSFFFSKGGSVLDYVLEGRCALVLGDPIGPRHDLSYAISSFLDHCSASDWLPVFIDIPAPNYKFYTKFNMQELCVGEEAIVDLTNFSLEGGENRDVRYQFNKLLKLGYTTRVYQPPHPPELLSELKRISDTWLTIKHGREKRFWVGWFDADLLNNGPVMVVEDASARRIAFSTILSAFQSRDATVDMMRHIPEAEHGVMQFLFVSMFLWAKELGYKTFDLGLSALAGVGISGKDPAIDRVMHYIYEHIDQFFNFKGLHQFKDKFHPTWEKRYIVFPKHANLPTILWAMLRADSGKGAAMKYSQKL